VRTFDARDAHQDYATNAGSRLWPRPSPSGAVMPPPDMPSEQRRLSQRQSETLPGTGAAGQTAFTGAASHRQMHFPSPMQSPRPSLSPAQQSLRQSFSSAPTRTHRSMDDYALARPFLPESGSGQGMFGLDSFALRPRSVSHAQDLYQHSAAQLPVRGLPHRQIHAAAPTLRDDLSHTMRSPELLSASPLSLADNFPSERRRDSIDSLAGSKRPRSPEGEHAEERLCGRERHTGGPCASPETCSSLAEETNELAESDGLGAAQSPRPMPSHLEIMARLKHKVTARLAAKEQASRTAQGGEYAVRADSGRKRTAPPAPSSAPGSPPQQPGGTTRPSSAAARRRAASHSQALETPIPAAGSASTQKESPGVLAALHSAGAASSGGIEALLTAASLQSPGAGSVRGGGALAEPAS
jgi:hypothetical protein